MHGRPLDRAPLAFVIALLDCFRQILQGQGQRIVLLCPLQKSCFCFFITYAESGAKAVSCGDICRQRRDATPRTIYSSGEAVLWCVAVPQRPHFTLSAIVRIRSPQRFTKRTSTKAHALTQDDEDDACPSPVDRSHALATLQQPPPRRSRPDTLSLPGDSRTHRPSCTTPGNNNSACEHHTARRLST